MVRMIAHVRIETSAGTVRSGQELEVTPKQARSLVRLRAASVVEGTSSALPATDGDLPADFPHREILIGLGLTTLAAVRGAKALGRRKGMGPARAAEVAAALEG